MEAIISWVNLSFFVVSVDVKEGEALGFFEALSWIEDLGLKNVETEGDAKVVVDAIKSDDTLNTVFGNYVEACRNILASHPNYSIHFVRREANLVAHCYARAAHLYESFSIWIEPPNFVEGLSLALCNCNLFWFFKKKNISNFFNNNSFTKYTLCNGGTSLMYANHYFIVIKIYY